jgi:hypothetical protein
MWMKSVRWLVGRAWDARVWRPQHARLLWSQLAQRHRKRDAGLTDRDHLMAATDWLCRAQEVMPDGGVSGRYSLHSGWSSSYPETTGYIIPTFLALAQELRDDTFQERAARAVRFLLSVQLPSGAFPGGEIRNNTGSPSVFNTGQILGGLTAWHRSSCDPRTLQAADRAAHWLASVQGTGGAWRRHVYGGVATTYTAYASCWLAEFGEYRRIRVYLDAAGRHLDWVLHHQDPESGWFDLAGFTADDHVARRAVTHTIAYTLWGVLRTSEILRRSDGIAAVAKAADLIARRLELTGWLPGILDHRWRECAPYACLTGNAQMALTWLRLYRHTNSASLLGVACKALDLVACAQPMFMNDHNIRGGVPGSAPIWGEYLRYALPNWAAKFFIDALLEKKRALGDDVRPCGILGAERQNQANTRRSPADDGVAGSP